MLRYIKIYFFFTVFQVKVLDEVYTFKQVDIHGGEQTVTYAQDRIVEKNNLSYTVLNSNVNDVLMYRSETSKNIR